MPLRTLHSIVTACLFFACTAFMCSGAEEDYAKELSLDLSPTVKLDLVLIPAGTFDMGSPETEEGHKKSETLHPVTITKAFYMGKYEVTQEQFEAIMKDTSGKPENPSRFKGATLPVERVTWDEAAKFCEKLSDKAGKTVKLPTEAQWEYACRAGTKTAFNTGDSMNSEIANYNGEKKYGPIAELPKADPKPDVKPEPKADNPDETNTEKKADAKPDVIKPADIKPEVKGDSGGENRGKTLPAGSFKPNAFGLYDMHGNVWEWVRDFYDDQYYSNSPKEDPEGPTRSSESLTSRVIRGGSYYSWPADMRSATRDTLSGGSRNSHGGFRIIVLVDH